MSFYKAGDGFATASKIPVKIYLFATVVCKTYLDKKIYEYYALNRSVQMFL